MALVKARNNRAVMDPFRSMFDDFLGENWGGRMAMKGYDTPAANIKETEKVFLIELAAPGMSKEDFNIEVEDDVLTISNQHESENEEKHDDYSVREFNYSSFNRSFRLPDNVEGNKIKANYKDGMLHLQLPKTEHKLERTRQIKVD